MEIVDFLPEQVKAQRARRRRLLRQAYMLAVCVGALIVLGHFRQQWLGEARAQLVMLEDRKANTQQQLLMLDTLERRLKELMVKKRIDEHLGSRVDILDVMGELQWLLPESMALTDLNLETMAVYKIIKPVGRRHGSARPLPATGWKNKEQVIKRIRLIITGIAPTNVDVANFIGQLSASPLFEDVNMGYTKNLVFRNRRARQFQASCYVAR